MLAVMVVVVVEAMMYIGVVVLCVCSAWVSRCWW